jgi:hypothetical protein
MALLCFICAACGTTGSRVPNSSGLLNPTLLFTPSDAQRSDSFDPPAKASYTDRFLAIDYQLLQQALAAATAEQTAPQPVGTSSPDAPAHSTEALAQEVETLKKALESVQQQLGNQTQQQK